MRSPSPRPRRSRSDAEATSRRFTIYAERPTEGVRLTARSCADPRLVAAWPTVMGLPPGSYELQAESRSRTRDGVTSNTSTGAIRRLVDELFPLVWVALYALLPVSESSSEFQRTSFDQSARSRGAPLRPRERLCGCHCGQPDRPRLHRHGGAHPLGGRARPGDALTALTRISYVLSVAGCLVLVRVLVRRLASDSPAVSLPAQLSFVVLVFVAGTWHWSDIAWSHFYAAFLAVAFYALRLLPTRPALAVSALTGVVLAVLALTRSFELMAVLAGWGLAVGLFAVLRIRGNDAVATLGPCGGYCCVPDDNCSCVCGDRQAQRVPVVRIGSWRGIRRPAARGDRLDSHVRSRPHSREARTALPRPVHLLALRAERVRRGRHDVWKQPLTIQLPALVVLPLCILALAALVFRAAKRRERASGRARELRLLVELTAVASGLTLGYIASSWSSSTALGYGFARDFMLPFLLTGVVSVALAFSALDHVLSRRESIRLPAGARLSRGAAYWAVAMLGAVGLVTATLMARTWGLPRLESRHLAALEYDATCAGARCTVEVVAANPQGRNVDVPGASLLTIGCGGDEPRFTVRVEKPSRGFPVPPTCRDPRLVAAWPMIMGTPPNSEVLRTIEVANWTGG